MALNTAERMDRSYTNRDVRDHPELEEYAHNYLNQYTGEFYVLCELKQALSDGAGLTITQTRVVLNCMLADPRVGDMPTPSGSRRRFIDFTGGGASAPKPPRKTRPAFIKLKSHFHLSLGISGNKRAYTIHNVDTSVSALEYYTGIYDSGEPEFRCNLRWLCSSYRAPDDVELIDYATANMLIEKHGWKPCVACSKRKARLDASTNGKSS